MVSKGKTVLCFFSKDHKIAFKHDYLKEQNEAQHTHTHTHKQKKGIISTVIKESKITDAGTKKDVLCRI